MVDLRLLGSLDLSGDPEHLDAVEILAKPKLTALLAYLLLARTGEWYRRDELAALFWTDSDQAHARRALSQSIYQLRQHLGSDAIESRGKEDLRLAGGVVRCDALEVRRASEAGRWEEAVNAYAGDLLPAFHLPNDGDFTAWLDGERNELRRIVAESAMSAGEKARRENDAEAARVWFARAAATEPLDRDRIGLAIVGVAESGDPKAALDIYEEYRAALARELELEPDEELTELVETIRQSRSLPSVRVAEPTEVSLPRVDAGATGAPPPADALRGPGRWTTLTIMGAGVFILALLLAPLASNPPVLDPGLVAIMPFGFEGPESDDPWLASALPVGLGPLLDGTAGLEAVSEQRMNLALDTEGKSWDSELSADEARTVARAVGAGAYLTATIVSDGEHQRIVAALTDTESGEERQRVQFAVDTLDLNRTIDRLVAELLIGAAGQFRQSDELLSRSPAALRAYVDGWAARREQRHLDALRHFHTAMNLDTTFVLAALAYGEASMWMPDGTPHRLGSELAANIMGQFRDHLSEADRAVSEVLFHSRPLTGVQQLEGARRATLLAPDRPSAWLLLGDFLLHDGMMLGIPNHIDLAAAAFDSALALGDITPEAGRHLIEIPLAARDTAFAREYLASNRRNPEAFSHLWWVAASLAGDSAQLAEFGEVLDQEPASTWRWMLMWSQRAETGFEQADRAAELLAAMVDVDVSVQRGNRYYLMFYHLNRGRPREAFRPTTFAADVPMTRFQTVIYPEAVRRLEFALVAPRGWVDVEAIAARVLEEYPTYSRTSQMPAACDLGLWHARIGDRSQAEHWASALTEWMNEPKGLVRSFAKVCAPVIRAELDAAPGLPALEAIASDLSEKPIGITRLDDSRWSLGISEAYFLRGEYDQALPLTTRLGYLAESSAWLTPALIREGELSLLTGDTVRAAVAYARAARLLSAPEPEIAPFAEEVRLTAERLSDWVSRDHTPN